MNNKLKFTNYNLIIVLAIIAIVGIILSACSTGEGIVTTSEEEFGRELALNENYDTIRNGARLVLSYDTPSNSFIGFVKNTTDKTLKKVRVEVHLSNGVELGPTTPTDIDPGESVDVVLKAADKDFDGWTAHPEVGESGNGEHSEGDSD